MQNPPKNPIRSLTYALEKYPERVELIPLRDLVAESARQNEKRPAYVKLNVPDEIVKGLRGNPDDTDLVLVVRVPREILQRQDSLIVLPGEVR
ncbi:MAG TPA: hypothetical protein VN493_20795 [Thermoanaerobaculia bacterium]|nr:hypothetical protein [Thermoanaerobaculia bacterium]